ncbi:hypothetical protein ASPVEDRAFT_57042 [Aspergillus versicolor CBS 583.65]|uniref:BZIP domain-containing protein n=1 Tax=Aspergillus versicolor CBS 583.65 TaxID=1036611 RepID=A0A1L9Q1X6_ASPVE|nr:uncharacterized protein ASPVEDRAFT_57042 [Aspergillus versicolor CBS 583.65]OJJ07770.1 hypothetical protein ASPVEDRAFT_57042 [Aspergillus versicolor CBS 583.65]
MPAKHHSPEQSESPKQDPTERRRLQNRLSQRNHRRKIRDRIAKLQERVIASELRAAATLHGWHSAPCIPYEVKPSPSSTSSSLSLSPSSPPAEMQCPPASYNVGLNTMPQLPLFPTPGEYDETGTGVSSLSGSGTSSPTTLVPPDIVAGPGLGLSQGYGLDTVQMCEQWGFQGSVYLATETSLPQILQTLGPSSNAIILLQTPGYSVGGGTMGYTSQEQADMSGCQCQSLGWITCPLHPMG